MVHLLLERLKRNAANLIKSVREKFGESPPFHRRLTTILRRLLDEQVPISDLAGILESLLSLREVEKNGAGLAVYSFSEHPESPLLVADGKSLTYLSTNDFAFAARLGVRSLSVRKFAFAARLGVRSLSVRKQEKVQQILPVLPLSHEFQTALTSRSADGVHSQEECDHFSELLRTEIFEVLNENPSQDLAFVVNQYLRAGIRELLRFAFPTVPVLGSSEVPYLTLAEGYQRLGDRLNDKRKFPKAFEAYRQAILWAPEKADCHAKLADALTSQGDFLTGAVQKNKHYSEAVEEYLHAIDINHETACYHHHLSCTLKKLHDWERASKELRETIRLDDKNVNARRELAACLSRQKKFDDAVHVLEASKEAFPSDLEIQMDLAKAYAQASKYDQAVSLAERISTVENPPEEATELLTALRNAQATASKLLTDPENPALIAELGQIHVQLGNLQAAIAQYRRTASLEPSKPDHHKRLVNTLFKAEDWEDAASEWKKDVALARCDAVPLFHLGNCYYHLGHPEKAIVEWEKAIRINPMFVDAIYNLGVALWATVNATGESHQKAVEYWKVALNLDRNLSVAENNLQAVTQAREPDLAIFDLLRSR